MHGTGKKAGVSNKKTDVIEHPKGIHPRRLTLLTDLPEAPGNPLFSLPTQNRFTVHKCFDLSQHSTPAMAIKLTKFSDAERPLWS